MPLSGEDKVEIYELYARYCQYYDAGQAAKVAALFTPDATFTNQPAASAGGSPIQFRGTAELAAWVQDRHEKYGDELRHYVTGITLDELPTGAKGVAYCLVLRRHAQQPATIMATGRYFDELVKDVDVWRFRSRIFVNDG